MDQHRGSRAPPTTRMDGLATMRDANQTRDSNVPLRRGLAALQADAPRYREKMRKKTTTSMTSSNSSTAQPQPPSEEFCDGFCCSR